jgi:hypothetical protein
MKTRHTIVLAGLLLGGLSLDAQATNFSGTFDIVQTLSSGGTTTMRYWNAANHLFIYASNDTAGSLLREAFYRKATVTIAYTPIVCPAGESGTCGNVGYVQVKATDIP